MTRWQYYITLAIGFADLHRWRIATVVVIGLGFMVWGLMCES